MEDEGVDRTGLAVMEEEEEGGGGFERFIGRGGGGGGGGGGLLILLMIDEDNNQTMIATANKTNRNKPNIEAKQKQSKVDQQNKPKQSKEVAIVQCFVWFALLLFCFASMLVGEGRIVD